jgi:hypothetical protein
VADQGNQEDGDNAKGCSAKPIDNGLCTFAHSW